MFTYPMTKDRVCVTVERVNGRTRSYRVMEGSIGIMSMGTMVTDLANVKGRIVDNEGNEIKPTGRFLISVETIDPYHLVTDMF